MVPTFEPASTLTPLRRK